MEIEYIIFVVHILYYKQEFHLYVTYKYTASFESIQWNLLSKITDKINFNIMNMFNMHENHNDLMERALSALYSDISNPVSGSYKMIFGYLYSTFGSVTYQPSCILPDCLIHEMLTKTLKNLTVYNLNKLHYLLYHIHFCHNHICGLGMILRKCPVERVIW